MAIKKREKYEHTRFDLAKCKANINIVESSGKGKGFATAFLNVHLPDGRWVAFEISDAYRVPLYKEPQILQKKEV